MPKDEDESMTSTTSASEPHDEPESPPNVPESAESAPESLTVPCLPLTRVYGFH